MNNPLSNPDSIGQTDWIEDLSSNESDEDALLTTLRAAANYICRAKSDYYPADVRDTLIKALTYHIVRLAATSDV